jgi:Fe-S cluster biogenesis protein NfuA
LFGRWPYDDRVTDSDTPESVFLRVGGVLQQIRPAIQADGGDVELVEVTDEGLVRVRFHGACVGCPSSTMTLKTGIEHSLRERVPEVTGVEAVEV